MSSIAGLILCGGQSLRMGLPKAWLDVHGTPLLTHVVRLVSLSARPVVVVAGPEQVLPELPHEIRVVRDLEPFEGPLAGLIRGLDVLPDSVSAAYVTGVDMPCLAPGWIGFLHSMLGDYDVAVPVQGGKSQPLAAVYHTRVIHPARSEWQGGGRSLRHLCTKVRARLINETTLQAIDPGLLSLRGANTPEEWAALLRDWPTGLAPSS